MPIAFRVRIASRIVAVKQMNFIGSNARILVFSDELREGSAKKGKLLRSLPVVRGVKPSGGIVNRSHKISSLVQVYTDHTVPRVGNDSLFRFMIELCLARRSSAQLSFHDVFKHLDAPPTWSPSRHTVLAWGLQFASCVCQDNFYGPHNYITPFMFGDDARSMPPSPPSAYT